MEHASPTKEYSNEHALNRHFYPAESSGSGMVIVDITADRAGWQYSGLRILALIASTTHEFATGTTEMAILPLYGGLTVEVEAHSFRLEGRDGVFGAVTDFAFVPIDVDVRITTQGRLEIALCTAEATRRIEPYRVAADDGRVEVMGGGAGTRQINNCLSADVADSFLLPPICTRRWVNHSGQRGPDSRPLSPPPTVAGASSLLTEAATTFGKLGAPRLEERANRALARDT